MLLLHALGTALPQTPMTPLAGPSKVDHAVLGGAGSDEADTAALTPSVELVSGERPGADAAVSVLSREDILADERTDEDDAIVVQLQAVEESALYVHSLGMSSIALIGVALATPHS